METTKMSKFRYLVYMLNWVERTKPCNFHQMDRHSDSMLSEVNQKVRDRYRTISPMLVRKHSKEVTKGKVIGELIWSSRTESEEMVVLG